MGGILVTGGTGQVASALVAVGAARRVDIVRVGRPDFDFERPETIDACFARIAPSLVINAAAYTAVDRAEAEPEAADRANHTGPGRLAELCAAGGARLVHISTDYVFDGTKPTPYIETDATGPTGVYGATKLAGEQAVRAALPDALILRTAWVYAATGKNFLLTMLSAARKVGTLKVVADQVGCPTLAADLATAILDIVGQASWQGGLYHAAGEGATSWHGFATAIFERAAQHGLARPTVLPIATADWPTPARRPGNSRLDCARLGHSFGIGLPDWRRRVEATVDLVMAGQT